MGEKGNTLRIIFLCYAECMEETTTKRPRGRPPTGRKDYDKPRGAGRQPAALWEACEAQAQADEQSMTGFITEALTRELARRQAD